MRGVTVHATAAHASGKVSEDSYGHVGDADFGAAWVIDGATSLGDEEYAGGGISDAAWYAQQFSEALHQHSLWPLPVEEIFSTAIRQVAKAWQDAVGALERDIPRFALPSAAGIWVRWRDGLLETVSLGDCRGWHMRVDGVLTQLALLDEKANDDWVAEIVKQQQSAGVLAHDMRAATMGPVRAARSHMNQASGYWIFGIHAETAQHLSVRRVPLTPGHMVLCSDGLFRWVDVLHQGGSADFTCACVEDIAGVLTRVRELENNDKDCVTFPRLKCHDDATGMVLFVDN